MKSRMSFIAMHVRLFYLIYPENQINTVEPVIHLLHFLSKKWLLCPLCLSLSPLSLCLFLPYGKWRGVLLSGEGGALPLHLTNCLLVSPEWTQGSRCFANRMSSRTALPALTQPHDSLRLYKDVTSQSHRGRAVFMKPALMSGGRLFLVR